MRPTLQDRTDQTPKAYPMMPISRRRLDLPLLLTGALLTIGCAAGEPISEFEEEFSTRPDTATLSPRSVAIGGFETVQVERTAWHESWRAPGRLIPNPNATHTLGSTVDGRVTGVYVYPGDRVSAGAVLVSIYSPQALDADAGAVAARANLLSAESRLRLAAEREARARRLHEARALSQAELEGAITALIEAKARYETAKSELQRAEELYEHLIGSEPRPDGIGRGEALVRAPIDGVVIRRETEAGRVTMTGTPMITITRPESLALSIQLPEEAVAVARRGATVHFTTHAYPGRTFEARVERVAAAIDAKTRTLEVIAEVDNSEGLLKPEMYVDTRVLGEPDGETIVVPAEAVHLLDEIEIVVRAAENGDGSLFIEAVPVRTGRRTAELVELLAGIEEGTRLVVENAATARAELVRRR